MIERAQISEAAGVRPAARYVVSDGSALVDLMAWAEADFYRGVFDEAGLNHLMRYLSGGKSIPFGQWWRFVRKAPEVWLINVLNLACPPVPEVLIVLEADSAELMERLRSRGKQLQQHENPEFLDRLQEAYRIVAEVLRRRHRVELILADPRRDAPAELVQRIVEVCRQRAKTPVAGSAP